MIDIKYVCPYFLWLLSCTICTSRLGALIDILFAASLGLYPKVFGFSLISNFSKFFLVFRVFLLSVRYGLVTVLANKGKGVLRFKVTSKALSTSSSASLSSPPWTRCTGRTDEFFNFRTMSVPQAQHKLGTIGEINSMNFLCGPADCTTCLRDRRQRLCSLAQYYGGVIAKSGTKHVA